MAFYNLLLGASINTGSQSWSLKRVVILFIAESWSWKPKHWIAENLECWRRIWRAVKHPLDGEVSVTGPVKIDWEIHRISLPSKTLRLPVAEEILTKLKRLGTGSVRTTWRMLQCGQEISASFECRLTPSEWHKIDICWIIATCHGFLTLKELTVNSAW